MITSEGWTSQTPQWTTSGKTGCHCWRFDTKPSGSVDFTVFVGGFRFRDFSDEQLDQFRLEVQEIFGKKILAINIPAAGTTVFILFDDEQNEIVDSLSKKTTHHFGQIVEGERIEVLGQWIHFKPVRKQSSLAPEPVAAPAAPPSAPAEGSFDVLAPGADGSWEISEGDSPIVEPVAASTPAVGAPTGAGVSYAVVVDGNSLATPSPVVGSSTAPTALVTTTVPVVEEVAHEKSLEQLLLEEEAAKELEASDFEMEMIEWAMESEMNAILANSPQPVVEGWTAKDAENEKLKAELAQANEKINRQRYQITQQKGIIGFLSGRKM